MDRPWQLVDAAGSHQRLDARQAARRLRAGQMPQRQHRVGLAAAEIGLQLDHRVAALLAEPAHGVGQEALQPVGQVGPPVELGRVAILVAALAARHLGEVGRELGLGEPAGRHVAMRGHDLAPRLQAGLGGALQRQRGRARLGTRLLVADGLAQLLA